MKRMSLVVFLLIIGGCFSGCVGGLVDKGAEVAEEKLQAIEGEQYLRLKAAMEAKGGDISTIDANLDGRIDETELKTLPIIALKNPTAGWLWSEEFWIQLAGLFTATFGWRGIRRFRDTRGKKSKHVPEEKEPAEPPVK